MRNNLRIRNSRKNRKARKSTGINACKKNGAIAKKSMMAKGLKT